MEDSMLALGFIFSCHISVLHFQGWILPLLRGRIFSTIKPAKIIICTNFIIQSYVKSIFFFFLIPDAWGKQFFVLTLWQYCLKCFNIFLFHARGEHTATQHVSGHFVKCGQIQMLKHLGYLLFEVKWQLSSLSLASREEISNEKD